MPVNVASHSIRDIAACYGITRQRLHQIRRRQDLSIQDFLEPDLVFERLLTTYDSPLRKRLSDPATRATIHAKLRRP